MGRIFDISGVNTATGKSVSYRILADNENDAAEQVARFGLEARTIEIASSTRPPPPRPRVLVVDDAQDIRDLLLSLLRIDGYEADGVADASEALDYLRSTTPSLIITDFMMPRMTGLELVTEIRANPLFHDVPILMFTAVSEQVRDQAIDAGCDALVSKDSLDWAILKSELERLIGRGLVVHTVPRPAPKRVKASS